MKRTHFLNFLPYFAFIVLSNTSVLTILLSDYGHTSELLIDLYKYFQTPKCSPYNPCFKILFFCNFFEPSVDMKHYMKL